MRPENVSRTVLASGVGAVLAAAALVYVPEPAGRPAALPPGPTERAGRAAEAGAPAALPDLAALIGDRERWVAGHPGDDTSWALLGTAYAERGLRRADPADFTRAERALKRSLTVRPAARGNLDAQAGLAALANARGDWAAGRQWGERVRAAAPKRWSVYPVLIDAYDGLGDYKAARRAGETLTELHGGSAAGAARSAALYRVRGWREDAGAAALDAVALAETPAQKADALSGAGDLAGERGEPAEALARYGAALELVADHGPSLAGQARAKAALGRTAEALRDWRAAVARLPLPEYVLEAGELAEALGRDAEAEASYRRLRTGAWVRAEVTLGRLEADHGDPARAVRGLRAAWARGHRSLEVADALGWALLRAGEPKEALPYAKRATEEGLRSALFSYHRGEIERALGESGAARRHLSEALRTDPEFSPLFAPRAREALAELGEPPDELPELLPGAGAPGAGKPDVVRRGPSRPAGRAR
ncbi:tetratricopeptide repeat protein [Streptomyces sp. NPDC048718]|uniref:tetratricopeptide repeat protein n=1 Tax=Streptomyces sp. NPDC048718 TaxID=3365587 RepID=UPI0037222D14